MIGWSLCQIFSYQATTAVIAGEPIAARAAAEEGRDLADALGDRFVSTGCRVWLGVALRMQGDLAEAVEVSRPWLTRRRQPETCAMTGFGSRGPRRKARPSGARRCRRTCGRAIRADGRRGDGRCLRGHGAMRCSPIAALAGGDAAAARQACEDGLRRTRSAARDVHQKLLPRWPRPPWRAAIWWPLAVGPTTPSRWCRAATSGRADGRAPLSRSPQGEPDQAERDAHEALAIAARTQGYLRVPDTLECLARLAADDGNHPYAARLLGAADGIRQRTGTCPLPDVSSRLRRRGGSVREALGQNDFDAAWAEGAALSTEEAIAYAQRGRGERKRPASGWGSLTPMEHDVVRLVAEGLGNKDIGARLSSRRVPCRAT